MKLRILTSIAVSLPLLACGLACADDDKSAPASDAATTAAAKTPDDANPADEAKPAVPAAKPAPAATPLLPRLRGQAAPARRPAADAVRAGLGAALRAAGDLQDTNRPPAENDEADDRRPPPPSPKHGYAPPGGFAGDEDNPPPPDGPPPPPPPRRPGDDGPQPPRRAPRSGPEGPLPQRAAPDLEIGPPPPDAPRGIENNARPARPGGLGHRGGAGLGGLRPVEAQLAPQRTWAGPRDIAASEDPEMQQLNAMEARLDEKARDLAARCRQTTIAEDRATLRGQLAEVVTKHFEIRQRRRQLELQRLEHQLDRLRGAIEKRTAARDGLIQQRTDQLLGEEQDTGF